MKLSLGDNVRFLNEPMDGIVSAIIDDKTVGVTVNNDFEIPVPMNQVVKISHNDFFARLEQKQAAEPKQAEKGFDEYIYLAFVHADEKNMDVFLVNHTQELIAVNYFTVQGKEAGNKNLCLIDAFQTARMQTLPVSTFSEWPVFHIQILKQPQHSITPPLQWNMKMQANKFFKQLRAVPLLKKQGYIFTLDNTLSTEDIKALEDFGKKETVTAPAEHAAVVPAPLPVIDLHIDKLHNHFTQLTKQETLQIQLEHFTRALDNAIATKMHKVTFIHGVGNGRLKNEILKIAKTHPEVREVRDADVAVYGNGASTVFFKL